MLRLVDLKKNTFKVSNGVKCFLFYKEQHLPPAVFHKGKDMFSKMTRRK